jgi:hypothetical protein
VGRAEEMRSFGLVKGQKDLDLVWFVLLFIFIVLNIKPIPQSKTDILKHDYSRQPINNTQNPNIHRNENRLRLVHTPSSAA